MPLNAEIIAVGTELLLGNITNTNARDISEELSTLGINVYYHTVVGDNPDRLHRAVEIARERADIIITIGGLGPTYDDMTKEVIANCFGKPLVFHEEIASEIRLYFEARDISMLENNLRQAYLPKDAAIFANSRGTAPGCAFYSEEKYVIMLPGPPRECRAMLKDYTIPYLRALISDEVIVSQNIHIFGMGESVVEEKLQGLMQRLHNPSLAPYARVGELTLRLTAKAGSEDDARALMAPILQEVQEVLGDVVYGIDAGSLEELTLKLLLAQRKTIATAESCTAGLLSGLLTRLPGASAAFMGGVAAYANEVKENLLGVPAELIQADGAVSDSVVRAMAKGARERIGADIGIGITGIAGPDGGSETKPVGLVYVALDTEEGSYVRRLLLGNDRERVRTMAVLHALDMTRRWIKGLGD